MDTNVTNVSYLSMIRCIRNPDKSGSLIGNLLLLLGTLIFMSAAENDFMKAAEVNLQNNALHEQMHEWRKIYNERFKQASAQFSNLELARERAARLRWKTIEQLDRYLIEFEANFIKSGGKVFWAQDGTDALVEILNIIKRNNVHTIIKSKSNTVSEINLNKVLETENVNVVETDVADFILQYEEESSTHMVMPALHKNKEQLKKFYHERFDLPENVSTDEMVKFTRDLLSEEFYNAGVGITGANFLVADPGAIIISENEGNALLCSSSPRIHIVICGIDKIVPALSDIDLMLPLLSTYGIGQAMSAYNHVISGPKQQDEKDGPEELYVILLDNGRSNVLEREVQRQALRCIGCGACQTKSDLYNLIGGNVYGGPIQAITAPLMMDTAEYKFLSDAQTLGEGVNEICPVKIDFRKLLLQNRYDFVQQGLTSRNERWFYYAWKKAMLKRELMRWTGFKTRKHIMESLLKSKEGLRKMPSSAPKSFNQQWREKK